MYLLRMGAIPWGTLVGLSLIVGGGAGNLVDRLLRQGRVGDFIMVGVGTVRTGIFNCADMAVLAGLSHPAFQSVHEKDPPLSPDN